MPRKSKELKRLAALTRRNKKLEEAAIETISNIQQRLDQYINASHWGGQLPAFVTRLQQKCLKARYEIRDFGTYWQRPQPPRKQRITSAKVTAAFEEAFKNERSKPKHGLRLVS
jgi:hypothetical protein